MLSDFKYGLRQLIKYPGFTAIAALTLAFGIGVNTTMYSVLNALVLQDSPARDSARLVAVFRTAPQSQEWPHAPANFYDYRKQSASYETLAAYTWTNYNLSESGQPAERIAGMMVSGDFFKMYGVDPALGRVIGPDDDKPGAPMVAVLSYGYWRTHFSGDPGIVGRTVRINGQQYTIIGVASQRMGEVLYWGHVDMWAPLALEGSVLQNRDNNWLQGLGRLKAGVTLAQAQAEATAIAARLAKDYPKTNAENGLRLVSWNVQRVGEASRTLCWLCMALAGFVLMIACANLANLQLARMATRMKEHAVRIALGATRLQLIRQLVVESVLLAILGGTLGALLASWGTKLIGNGIYINSIQGVDLPVNTNVLLFTLVASMLTGIIVGVMPAWIASKTDVNEALKQGTRGSTGGRSRHLFRHALIVAELALALLLLSGAGYFVRGMQRLTNGDAGWKPDGLITGNLTLPFNERYSTDAATGAFLDKLSAKLAALPGARSSSIAASLPVAGFWRSGQIVVQGKTPPAKGKEPLVYYNYVTVGHLANVGIHLVSGRDFNDGDRANTHAVAIVNETMARDLWPGENPIGKRVRAVDLDHEDWLDVIGVVGDVRSTIEVFRPADTPFQLYRPIHQTPGNNVHWVTLAIRSDAPAPTVAAALRSAVREIDPDEPVYDIMTARDAMAQITSGLTLVSEILEVFALIGLVLAAIGIYGVIANLVAQRTAEIGIRMALGAQAPAVLWMVLGQGLRLAAVGTAIGLAASWGLSRVIIAALPAIHGADPVGTAVLALILVAVAILACWIPARRATLVNPVIALRGD